MTDGGSAHVCDSVFANTLLLYLTGFVMNVLKYVCPQCLPNMFTTEFYCCNTTIGAHKEKIEILSSILHTRQEFGYEINRYTLCRR